MDTNRRNANSLVWGNIARYLLDQLAMISSSHRTLPRSQRNRFLRRECSMWKRR